MLTDKFKVPIEIKFGNFTKYARRQKIARFLTQYEILKKQTNKETTNKKRHFFNFH